MSDDAPDDEDVDTPEQDEDIDEPRPSIDDVDVMQALRSALKPPDEEPEKIQRGVQKKIREQTRGRFFADGWSTSAAPRATFLVTSLLMLVIVVLAYLLLSPQGMELFK